MNVAHARGQDAAPSQVIGIQSDCSWQEIDNFFAAPVDEGGGVVSRLDSGEGGPDSEAYSALTVASCSEGDWITAYWPQTATASRLLEQLRASDERIADMGDEFAATSPADLKMGQDLRELPGFGLEQCGCDIFYDTDFGPFGASSR